MPRNEEEGLNCAVCGEEIDQDEVYRCGCGSAGNGCRGSHYARAVCSACCDHTQCAICASCFNSDAVVECGCCPEALEQCSQCCRHRCCARRNPNPGNLGNNPTIRFVPRPAVPVFWHPGPTGVPVPETDPEESERVLAGVVPAGYCHPKGFKRNRSRRFAAVEIEVAGIQNATVLNRVLDQWRCAVVSDGSLTSMFAGKSTFEINTAPACGDALVQQLQEITSALESGESGCNLTCGLHVHVDCRDLGYQEIRKLVILWKFIEQAMYDMVHPHRRNNQFCAPCGDRLYARIIEGGASARTRTSKSAIVNALYGAQSRPPEGRTLNSYIPEFWRVRTQHYGPGGRVRYSSLNLHSFFYRGTVECRMHHGSVLFSEIWPWTSLWVQLIDWVNATPEKKVVDVCALSRDAHHALASILDEETFEYVLKATEYWREHRGTDNPVPSHLAQLGEPVEHAPSSILPLPTQSQLRPQTTPVRPTRRT